MIFKISLISKRDIRPSSCTLGYSTCGWLRGWSVFFPPSPKTVTSVIMVMLLTFVVSKTMSVTVIDSNSSCYQNKITNCSGNHEASEVPKLLPIKRLSSLPKCPHEIVCLVQVSSSPPSYPPAPILPLQSAIPCWPGTGRRPSSSRLTPPPASQEQSLQWSEFVVLTLWVSDPQKRTQCADAGVLWPHVPMSVSMRRPGGGERGSGEGWSWEHAGQGVASVTKNNLGVVFP